MITADIKTATPKLSATIGGGATGKGNVTSVNKKIGDVVLTASDIHFLDGENFQEKYNSGELRGQKGDTGKAGEKGKDGTNGKNGKDGVSPTAEVTQGTGEAIITITDGKGTTTAVLKDGKTYDDTQVKANIKANADNIAKNTTRVEKLETITSGLIDVPVRATLNDYSWAEIAQIALLGANDENAFARYNLHVGDVKEVEINGTVSGVKFAGKYYCNIIGFNHNWEIEGKGISFGFGKSALTGGKDIAFRPFTMNDTDTNVGGWKGSKMYKETCPQFFNALSPDLQAVIAMTPKYTYNDNSVSITNEHIYIPSEFEVFGKTQYSYAKEAMYQKRYDYYSKNPSDRYPVPDIGQFPTTWWLRSPIEEMKYNRFCSSYNNVSAPSIAMSEYSFSPHFRVMGGTGEIGSMQNKLIDNERRIAELEKKLQTALLSIGGNV